MGKALIIPGADFSTNSIVKDFSVEPIFWSSLGYGQSTDQQYTCVPSAFNWPLSATATKEGTVTEIQAILSDFTTSGKVLALKLSRSVIGKAVNSEEPEGSIIPYLLDAYLIRTHEGTNLYSIPCNIPISVGECIAFKTSNITSMFEGPDVSVNWLQQVNNHPSSDLWPGWITLPTNLSQIFTFDSATPTWDFVKRNNLMIRLKGVEV